MRRLITAAARRARQEGGFTIAEVLAAILVLSIGIGAVFQLMVVATHATTTNKIRQIETSLARELTEDARSLGFTQLNSSALAGALQPIVRGATLSGTSLSVTRAGYTFSASFTACSLDDPADGLGNHGSPPVSNGSWCPDVAANGTQDSNPDDYKRVSVTVAPTGGRTTPTVQQAVLVYARATHGPAVSCLAMLVGASFNCPGVNQTVTTGASLTFNVTTTTPAATVQWLVNGSTPASGQVGTGGVDPYVPSGSSSTFTWNIPTVTIGSTTYTVDGTYTIAALAFDQNGNQGTRSSLQVTVNEHMVLPPSTVHAGWNAQIHGVDIQWVPSVDRDVLYYTVDRKVGNTITPVCNQVTGLTCTDLTASSPGTEPATCTYGTTPNQPGVYQSFTTSSLYYVVGWDTSGGTPRISTLNSAQIDANLCDHPPSAPSGLSVSSASGTVTLNWSLPASPTDADPGDGIQQWRIYRWPVGQNPSFPGSRLDLIGEKDASNNDVTRYPDRSADPGGVSQDYCITAVDIDLNESTCSEIKSG